MFRSTVLAAGLIAAPFSALAAPWVLDKSHAHITFSVDHLGFSKTQGAFREFDATIDFDPDNIEASSVSVTINPASVDTFFGKRDDHIRGGDFLNVGSFPEITFVSTAISRTGDNTATVTGDVTILGTTNSVSFDAVLMKMGPSPFNPDKMVAGMKLTGEIDRTQFGIAYGAPAIGAVIPVEIDLEMSPAQ